tara:strand:+ start:372 stop:953 length:582 start_codon:yes stop_codon:yes gene_type:complete
LRELLFFSNNKNKVIEIKKIFKEFNLKLLSLIDLNINNEPEENGKTFEENAKIKSDCGFNITGVPCFADDSGICIETLNWNPGVHSKRFLNNFKNNEICFRSIIQSTKNNGKQNAYFKTSISLTVRKDQNIFFNGVINGKISDQIKGDFGFGYDPIFVPKNYKRTLAELSTKEKNQISHRSIAVTKLINFLTN